VVRLVVQVKASAENFPGGATEKTPKVSKNTENSTIEPLPGGEGGNEKKGQKIAFLSLYLL